MSLHKGEPKPAIETAIVAAVLLTPQQLAERLAVPKSWVREKCRVRAQLHDSDPLPIVALGCYTRFDWNAVQAWLVRRAASRKSRKKFPSSSNCVSGIGRQRAGRPALPAVARGKIFARTCCIYRPAGSAP
jgi:hypothetical protein